MTAVPDAVASGAPVRLAVHPAVDAAVRGVVPASAASAMRFAIVEITPGVAARLLARCRPNGRRHAGAVRTYANAMRERRWLLNGVPVVVSRHGVLLDGMQRLLACVEARCAFETLFADGIDDEASGLQCRRHSVNRARVCSARGARHIQAVDAALRTLVRCAAGAMHATHPPAAGRAALDRMLGANPMIGQAVAASLARSACPLPEAVRSPLTCMGYALDPASTDRLLDAVTRPERFAEAEPGVVLRGWIDAGPGAPSPWPSETRLLALAIQALEATLRGTPLDGQPWTGSEPMRRFPQLSAPPGHAEAAPAAMRGADAAACTAGRQDGARVTIEGIGPHRAAQYLAQRVDRRRVSRAHVCALAEDIVEGRWAGNVQPICFAASGRLLDGQRRLRAVILSGGEIEVPVLRGLEEEASATYDIHARRGVVAGDAFEAFGDRALAAAMANLLWRHELRGPSTRARKASATDVRSIIASHPRLLLLRSFARRMTDFGRPSVIGYAAYAMERDDDALAHRFLRMFETGADLRPGHPILALRNVLQKQRVARCSQAVELSALLAGWERFKVWSVSPRGERSMRHRNVVA
ncbi:hypothetical protein [Roseomonas sp. HF4]|uniref:hypothetical protein n=1 Tax=Roseomonas sp. HF4 TaxID=2562313 RepID=UPI0010BFB410|nr:hypothetical protein [Roseomonas sp. HF4]